MRIRDPVKKQWQVPRVQAHPRIHSCCRARLDRDKQRQAGPEWAVSEAPASLNSVRWRQDCQVGVSAHAAQVVSSGKAVRQSQVVAWDQAEENFAAVALLVVLVEEECLVGAVAGSLVKP